MSVPLWLALLGYVLVAALVWTVALAVGLALAAVALVFLLAAAVGFVRRRRARK